MADKKTNIPPVTKATSVAVAPADGLDTAAALPAHCQPCPPTIRLDAPLRWKAANSKEQKLLRNLQGNILKGHGRDHTWNVFFTFGGDNAKTRRLLRQLGNGFVTDAYKQLLATEAFKTDDKKDGGTFCAAFLSAKGYQTLGLTFTAPPANAAFDAGMKAGQVALGDPPSTAWEAPFQQELHAMVLVADDDVARGSAAAASIRLLIADAGGTVHHTQTGTAIRNTVGNGLEHFGYIDGRSQPLMLLEDIEKESRDEGIAQWDPTFPLTTALVPDPLAPRRRGAGVRELLRVPQARTERPGLQDAGTESGGCTGPDRPQSRARRCVRRRPVRGWHARHDGRPSGGSRVAAQRLRLHAAMPRRRVVRSTPTSGRPTRAARAGSNRSRSSASTSWPAAASPTRTCRARSIPMVCRRPSRSRSSWPRSRPTCRPAASACCSWPTTRKIDDQFEFTQSIWANNPGFPNVPPPPPGLDGVIGQDAGNPGGQAYPNAWDNASANTEPFDFKGFVTMKGGEYFFAPSLHFLRNL